MQIPDVRRGADIIDAVVVDEEAVGPEERGAEAKILYGRGALDRYLYKNKLNSSEVRINLWMHLYKKNSLLTPKFSCLIN